MSLVLGLGIEYSCPWPREDLSSKRLSLASDFFCVLGLGLEPCVLDSTSDQWCDEGTGAYLGGPIVPWPPLGRQDCKIA